LCLGENEETRSFYNVYEHGLADDDNMELAYLQQQQDVVMANSDEEVEESRGIITVDELNRRLREVAHRNEVCLLYSNCSEVKSLTQFLVEGT
jgi:hypothetical protein